MRKVSTLVLAGVAAAALVGVTAAATLPRTHVLTIRLPGGSVEQLQYTGDIAPRVYFSSGAVPIRLMAPLPSDFMAFQAPFAAMDRISAQLNREMATVLANAPGGPMTASFGQLRPTSLVNLPAGARSYSVLSTFNGGHACTQSVEVTSMGAGKPAQVLSKSSGDCASAPAPAISALEAMPARPKHTV